MTGCPLDAYDTLPRAVLSHLSPELDIATPDLASLRALYGRRSPLYEHPSRLPGAQPGAVATSDPSRQLSEGCYRKRR